MAGLGANTAAKVPPLPWPIRNRYMLVIGRPIKFMIIIATLNLADAPTSRYDQTDTSSA